MLQAYVEGLGFLPSQVVRSITATAQRALDTAKAATAAVPTGAQAELPPPPPQPQPQPESPQIFLPAEEDKPFYKRPVFWFAQVGLTAFVAGVGYLLLRRKR